MRDHPEPEKSGCGWVLFKWLLALVAVLGFLIGLRILESAFA